MKKFLFGFGLLVNSVSFAALPSEKAQGVLEYKVTEATYSSVHVQNATRAQLTLNYDKSEVSLNIDVAFHCPDGRICAQVMPVPVQIELPIVSVKTDGCGVRTVTAQLDQRPADGTLQQIKISDPSEMTCRIAGVVPKATYTTSFVDRRDGKTVVNQSKMLLALKTLPGGSNELDVLETSLAPAIVIEYVAGSGFSPNPTLQTLYVDKIGRVINSVKVLRSGRVTTTLLAQLSPEALKNLLGQIATVPADAKLVDENENEPRCMDAPGSSIIVKVQNRDVTVYQRSGCHTLSIQEGNAYQLRDIMMGFASLTY